MSNVWVIAEHKDGKLKKVSLELVSKGKDLAAKTGGALEAVLIGSGVEGLADALGKQGAKKVYVVEGDALAAYSGDGYAKAAADLIAAKSPSIILIGATAQGKDLAPRIAARTGAGLASDCTGLDVDGGKLAVVRPIYAGKAVIKIAFKSDVQVASVRPNIFPVGAADGGAAEIEKIASTIGAGDIRTKSLEVVKAGGDKIELTEAEIIVSGGRGAKAPTEGNGWQLIETLAGVLGAAVGASRAAVDAGWREHDDQVGQTGKTVVPNLYVAAGISGAIQHLAGMSSAKCIVAINKDAEAPIFNVADYGIVGDLFQVLPVMTEEFKKLKEA